MKLVNAKGRVLLEVKSAVASGVDEKGFKDIKYICDSYLKLESQTIEELQKTVEKIKAENPNVIVEGNLPEPYFQGKGVELKFQGRSFKDDGITITPESAVGYPKFPNGDYRGAIGEMCDGEGNVIGTCKVTTKWRTPKSHVSSHQYQIEATIAGIRYTGRGGGNGMLWRGKRVA